MKTVLRALGAAFLTAGLLAVPSAAQAADDTPLLGALTERDADGRTVRYPIKPGETVPIVLGVTNTGTAPAEGVVVNIRMIDDLDLPKTFRNCLYYVDSNLNGAWCELATDLPVGGTHALAGLQVSAAAEAKKFSAVIFQWYPKDWADDKGGIEKLAAGDSGQGTTPVRGTEAEMALEPRELPIPKETARVGFAYLQLVTPTPSPSASAAPSTPPTADPGPTSTTPPASGEGGGEGDEDGGGLPVTGVNAIAIAGVGGVLLIGGVVAFLLTRRRNKFTA